MIFKEPARLTNGRELFRIQTREEATMPEKSQEKEIKQHKFSTEEFKRRYDKIRELMQLRDIDCLVITGNDSFYGSYAADLVYVTGQAPMMGGFFVFPLEGEPLTFIAGGGGGIGPIPVQMVPFKKGKGEGRRIRDWATGIANQIKELGLERGRIGISDMRVMPAGVYMDLLEYLPHAKFMPAGDLLLECRRIKSPEEQEFVRKSGEAADRGIEAIMSAARPGVTERELVNACEFAMIEAGAERGNFIILTSAPWKERDGSMSIPMRPDRKLKKGDLILNELSPNYGGYYVQQCVPISVGVGEKDMPKSFNDLFGLHKEMYELARSELKPGPTVTDIEKKIAELVSSRGNFSRALALQVGELAESHFRLNYAEMKAGMTWVNHPWTEPPDGKPGFRGHFLGNTFIVTEGEPEVTSRINCLELHVV